MTDLLVIEDHARFENFMASGGGSDGSRRLCVRFRTGSGLQVRCELHHVPFVYMCPDGNEEVWHLLGVCELGATVRAGSVDLKDNPSIPEEPPQIIKPTEQIDAMGNRWSSEASTQQQIANDQQKTCDTAGCGSDAKQARAGDELGTESLSTSVMTARDSFDEVHARIADMDHGRSMTVTWHKCGVQVLNASKKLVLDIDNATSEEVTEAMTKWTATSDFLQELVTSVLCVIKGLINESVLQRSKLGYTLNLNVSFRTSLRVTDLMLMGRDVPQSFQQLANKKSKHACITKQQARTASSRSCSSSSTESRCMSL